MFFDDVFLTYGWSYYVTLSNEPIISGITKRCMGHRGNHAEFTHGEHVVVSQANGCKKSHDPLAINDVSI